MKRRFSSGRSSSGRRFDGFEGKFECEGTTIPAADGGFGGIDCATNSHPLCSRIGETCSDDRRSLSALTEMFQDFQLFFLGHDDYAFCGRSISADSKSTCALNEVDGCCSKHDCPSVKTNDALTDCPADYDLLRCARAAPLSQGRDAVIAVFHEDSILPCSKVEWAWDLVVSYGWKKTKPRWWSWWSWSWKCVYEWVLVKRRLWSVGADRYDGVDLNPQYDCPEAFVC